MGCRCSTVAVALTAPAHSMTTAEGTESAEYCLTYHKNYGTIGYSGTSGATDDIADGKFQLDKFYAYAPCAEGGGTSGGSSPTESPDVSSAHSAIGTIVTVATIATAAAG